MESLLIYKGMSKIYDLLDVTYFQNKNRSPRTFVSKHINQQDTRILDICTGTATNAIVVATRYKEVEIIGIDISSEMLHIANKKVKKYGLQNVKLYEMDATETTFKDNTFNVILISLVLHEIPEELAEKILLEAKRILKPDGKLLVTEWEIPQSLLKKILFYPIRKLEPKGFEQFLRTDLNSYFEKFGFVISGIDHCDYTKVLYLKKSL